MMETGFAEKPNVQELHSLEINYNVKQDELKKRLKEKCRSDRARIQIGRISNFGLLEMTRQRLREGSIKWETQLSLGSFSQKILKTILLKNLLCLTSMKIKKKT